MGFKKSHSLSVLHLPGEFSQALLPPHQAHLNHIPTSDGFTANTALKNPSVSSTDQEYTNSHTLELPNHLNDGS